MPAKKTPTARKTNQQTQQAQPLGNHITQVTVAKHFAAQMQASHRHVSDTKTWLTWTDEGWTADPHRNHVTNHLTELLQNALPDPTAQLPVAEARAHDKARGALRKMENLATIESLLKLIARDPRISVPAAHLDAKPDLLGTPGATIDLISGRRRTPQPEDLLTSRTSVAHDRRARCPRWQEFLAEAITADSEALSYLQEVVGYCLTGHTSVQQMWLLTGEGSNGKSTFINTLMKLLGTYAAAAADTVLLKSGSQGGANNDIAALAGKRFVSLTETDRGRHLNEARLKQLISGDPVAARKLYQEFSTFTPEAKFFLATNHLPEVKGTDNGIWRRLVVIPFPHRFEGDPTLAEQLRHELPGILNWAVQGAKRWYENDRQLTTPATFQATTQAYRDDQDHVGRFLAAHTTRDPEGKTPAKELRDAYLEWCQQGDIQPLSPNEVGARLAARGFSSIRFGKGRNAHWAGLRVNLPAHPPIQLLADVEVA